MPYIDESTRAYMQKPTLELAQAICTKADLCYAVAVLMRAYTEQFDKPNWSAMSDAVAAVECAKLDFYAMVVQPYEEKKRKENGDVP